MGIIQIESKGRRAILRMMENVSALETKGDLGGRERDIWRKDKGKQKELFPEFKSSSPLSGKRVSYVKMRPLIH